MTPMPLIEDYQFGKMVISGTPYTRDLIIYPSGRIKNGWYRKNGHLLLLDDILTILESTPDALIIGQGASGRMAVDASVTDRLSALKIDFTADSTAAAVDKYHRMISRERKTAACFHLTC